MARKGRKGARRSRKLQLLLALLVLAGLAAAIAWQQGRQWRPDETRWPDQGALVGEAQGSVDFSTVRGLGAGFAYLDASLGASGKDDAFARNFAAARKAGLQVGAVHVFDPCLRADAQSANYVTIVPRDADLLPPAIRLDRTADACPRRIPDAAIQSEVLTLVNQIEAHTGKPAILAPSEEFETRYGVARRIDRNLWLTRRWFEPAYAGRPWLLWTANTAFATAAADQPLRWVVVRPEGETM